MSRAGFDVYRDLVNTPAFFAMLPPIDGRAGLDLGCGEGHNTRLLAERCAHVVALDIADVFVAAAAASTGRGVEFVIADAATLPFPSRSFDFVTAFMSLMDVGDPESALREMARVVEPGGFIQFSVLHPATATPIRRWVHDESGRREALVIGDYFFEGPFTERWTFGARLLRSASVTSRSRSRMPGAPWRGGSTPWRPPGSPSRRSPNLVPTSRRRVITPRSPTRGSPRTS